MPYGGSVQISPKLRKGGWSIYDIYVHWCPGCEEMHEYRVRHAGKEKDPHIPDWQFDGNINQPTFAPSMLIFEPQDNGGRVTLCHYTMTNGQIQFHGDCPHSMKGQTVPLPDLPEEYRD